jgi:uncharacterized protein YbaP (TraB family)
MVFGDVMKQVFLFLFALLCGAQVCAQSAVWKVSKGNNKIYLAGSLHVLREQDLPFPQEFERAFERSDAVVFEANLSHAGGVSSLSYMRYMALPPGKTLKTELNSKVYAHLARKSAELGMPIQALSRVKPCMAAMMLASGQMSKMGFSMQGADFHYFFRARRDNKRRYFLESVESQFKLFDGMNQNECVEQLLNDWDDLVQLPELVAEWKTGQTGLVEHMVKEMKVYPAIYNAMLKKRNRAWLPRLERFLNTAPTEFVIVGYAHLVGEDGLLRLLKKKGYKVERFQ